MVFLLFVPAWIKDNKRTRDEQHDGDCCNQVACGVTAANRSHKLSDTGIALPSGG